MVNLHPFQLKKSTTQIDIMISLRPLSLNSYQASQFVKELTEDPYPQVISLSCATHGGQWVTFFNHGVKPRGMQIQRPSYQHKQNGLYLNMVI